MNPQTDQLKFCFILGYKIADLIGGFELVEKQQFREQALDQVLVCASAESVLGKLLFGIGNGTKVASAFQGAKAGPGSQPRSLREALM